ncbi:hypothetical protein L3X38_000249 (mitochondrion) [Prunus dulcis]|uniref:Uncharacterized protein n=1 Tax=Prunus dulcis TaxID=3755 RepID=A0AAD4URL6_PRUDU|nr:hypothetical protein L3X38_000249 [Prunus dulcis]
MQVERCFRGAGQKEKRLLAKGSLSRPGATLGLRHGPDSYGRQQWGIFRNGRKPDGAISRDDDVELAAGKDSAFRRAARWCGGDDVKSAWPLWAGPHTCYNGNYNGKQGCKAERIRKDCLSSDCSLQLGNMKLESLVIADQHAAVNMYPGPVHTARHTLGIGFARSIGPMITHDFCVPLVPQRLLVVLLAHTTVGSSTGVKS